MYVFTKLNKAKSLRHAFSTLDDGDQGFDFLPESKVVQNRKRFLKHLGLSLTDCVAMRVAHGNKVRMVGAHHLLKGMATSDSALVCDGLVTQDKNVFLFLKVADCAPVVLYDYKNNVLGLVHIGWKNVETETIVKTIDTCKTSLKLDCKNLQVYIGPCIRKNSYIVQSPRQVGSLVWKSYLVDLGEGKFKVDFLGLFKKQLLSLGINSSNIFDCDIDTAKDHRFYSHFRSSKLQEGFEGRFACVVGMV